MIEIYMCKINLESCISSNSVMLNYVSEQKRRRINHHSKRTSADQSLIGEILARISICSNLKIPNEEIVFCTNNHKKPLLQSPEGYFFNISHAGDWVVCAFGHEPVGIDIERIKRIDYGIAEEFFEKKEFSLLMNKEEGERLTYFFKLWTLKESYVKAIGKGLAYPLNKFCIIDNGLDFHVQGELNQPQAFFQQFTVDESYIMSMCTYSQSASSVRLFSLQELDYLVPQLNYPKALHKSIKMLESSVSVYEGGGRYSLCF